MTKNFLELRKNLKKDYTALPKMKIALLGDSATQFLAQAIRAVGYEKGYDLDIWEADFNQIERQVFDLQSELYEIKPEFVIIFRSTHHLLGRFNKMLPESRNELAAIELETIQNIYHHVTDDLQAKLIYFNYPEIDDAVYGNFGNRAHSSFIFQLRKLNYELMDFAADNPNLNICDLSTIQNLFGKEFLFRPTLYITSSMVISTDALPFVAQRTVDIISASKGQVIKCVILDLDNTMWGGIIGDDGIENIQIGGLGIGKAFTEFQYWIKKLKERGVILAVCSKNTEHIAKEPFESHPDMVLRPDDISVFVANWENKADNIRTIQSILNIGFDSMVFLDDNPMERDIIRQNIPGIVVPELPEDPAEYLEFLYKQNLFETLSFSKEDVDRTKLYQTEARRMTVKSQFTDVNEYLKSLEMTSRVESFNKYNTPRVSQLTQRSNQFNLRTIRYSEADIQRLAADPDYFTFSIDLKDKFGDNGIICVVILKKEDENMLFIDTWLMSCRVLKRGVEDFVLNHITDFAKQHGFSMLKGEYLATPKNELVRDHFRDLGFSNAGMYWILDVQNYKPRIHNIKKSEV